MKVYLIGSLRNPQVQVVAKQLREAGYDVFDDWHSSGPDTDSFWKAYEQHRGRTYAEALKGEFAKNAFEFDKRHIEASDAVVLVYPAGRSAHLELGWALGQGKLGYVLLDDSDRWDIMLQFADGIFNSVDDLVVHLNAGLRWREHEAQEIPMPF